MGRLSNKMERTVTQNCMVAKWLARKKMVIPHSVAWVRKRKKKVPPRWALEVSRHRSVDGG